MNCYAYPLIFDAMKSNVNNNLLIELYDSSLNIYRKDEFVILRDDSGLIYYDLNKVYFKNYNVIFKNFSCVITRQLSLFCYLLNNSN